MQTTPTEMTRTDQPPNVRPSSWLSTCRDRRVLTGRVADMRQLAEPYATPTGRRVRLFTALGFDVDVLPDRGMDIGDSSFAGLPLTFCTPALWEPPPAGGTDSFAQRFGGGLLTTCGWDHFGSPVIDHGQLLPQHGRATELIAADVSTGGEWTNSGYRIWVSGRMRQ